MLRALRNANLFLHITARSVPVSGKFLKLDRPVAADPDHD
jgi:hypothetical protein